LVFMTIDNAKVESPINILKTKLLLNISNNVFILIWLVGC